MSFKQFTPHRSTRTRGITKSNTPFASLNSTGILRFNAAAAKKYQIKPHDYCHLFYSEEKGIIGLKIVEEETPNTLRFYNTTSTTEVLLGTRKFMEHYKIPKMSFPGRELSYDKVTGLILVHGVKKPAKEVSVNDFNDALSRAT